MIIKGSPIPELTFENMHPDNAPIFPLLMLTITCGALSGFHATQSPIISRTLQTENTADMYFRHDDCRSNYCDDLGSGGDEYFLIW